MSYIVACGLGHLAFQAGCMEFTEELSSWLALLETFRHSKGKDPSWGLSGLFFHCGQPCKLVVSPPLSIGVVVTLHRFCSECSSLKLVCGN